MDMNELIIAISQVNAGGDKPVVIKAKNGKSYNFVGLVYEPGDEEVVLQVEAQ